MSPIKSVTVIVELTLYVYTSPLSGWTVILNEFGKKEFIIDFHAEQQTAREHFLKTKLNYSINQH